MTPAQRDRRRAANPDLRARVCKNAGEDRAHQKRPAPFVGPRCTTCNREEKKRKKQDRRDKHLEAKFGMTQPEYDEVKKAQDGVCICGAWTGYDGSTRPLSIDHDHETGIIRGLLCKHCNDLLGRVHDDPAYFKAMIRYLESPPAVRVLGVRYAPGTGPAMVQ